MTASEAIDFACKEVLLFVDPFLDEVAIQDLLSDVAVGGEDPSKHSPVLLGVFGGSELVRRNYLEQI